MGETPSDPVQLYLTQMGDSPLLSRQEELESARRIEITRKRLRRVMLSSDYVLHAAVGMLEKAARGRLRVEMICEGTLSDDCQKRRLLAVIGTNLRTIGSLLQRNRVDFTIAVSKRRSRECRCQARRRLLLRRTKTICLVEESPIRWQHLLLVLKRLEEIGRRMEAAARELRHSVSDDDLDRRGELRKELHHWMRITHETPGTLRRRLARIAELRQVHDLTPRKTLGRQFAIGCVDRQALSQPRHQLFGLDSRGQHRIASGGGQV